MVKFNLDTREFNQTLKEYAKYSKRDAATICNTKAFFIARRAVIETPKAKKSDINKMISRRGSVILGKIINARRGAKGFKGLYGDTMRDAQLTVIAARRRSIAFLKSGWLPAVKILERLAEKRGAPRRPGSDIKEYGKKKGAAVTASSGKKVFAEIINAADAEHDKKQALITYGLPALQRAFSFETNSMREYVERKFKETARKLGIKTL
jgi:hypothetical protein